MFAAQPQQLGRSQLFVHKSYRISDVWGRGDDGSERMAIQKKVSDAAVFRDLDPDMKGRVLQAGKNSANGKTTPEDKILETKIEAMLELGRSHAVRLRLRCSEFATRRPNPKTISRY